MIVVDASVLAELLLVGSGAAVAEERLFGRGVSLHAPHVMDLEVTSVLRRLVAAGIARPVDGKRALAVLLALPIERHRHDVLLDRIWALRGNLTAYDAAYVALAEALDAPLVTFDGNAARSPGHRARIELLQRPG